MRRIRLRTGRTTLFLAMFAVALVVFLPMRLMLGWVGLGDQGLTARRVAGTIWSGTLRDARFGEVAIGDLSAGMSPFDLLLARARIGVESLGGTGIDGAITVSRHSLGIAGADATIPVGRAFAPLPITALDLSDVTVRFADGVCDAAEGRVRATFTSIGATPVAQTMSGSVKCQSGALLIPLAGQSGTETANLSLWQDGRYRAELTLLPGDPAAAVQLQTAGFVQAGAGWRLSAEGRF